MADIKQAKKWLADADAVVVTAGNGLAREEGLDILSEEEFDNHFGKIAEKYHVHTIGDALDKKFDSWDEQWQFWSQLIKDYSLDYEPSETMLALKQLLAGKEYFIATSTFGHFFEKAGINEKRIFNAFGDWTRMQCSSGINHGQFSDLAVVKQYLAGNGAVPKCEDCNSPMELHMPLNAHFFPDTDANTCLRWFLTGNEDKKLVVLELGVDETSPQLLDPMVNLVAQYPNWKYIAADLEASDLADSLQKRVIAAGQTPHDFMMEISK
ncbi:MULTISPECIES: Sir2 family NAD-dependent protein deacetylase [Lactobacillus]|uniref:Sir2 family NAD-dependent protein deacetylase n=1 Tax=Lactobacillus xujianguonis TaxID=2495899 RepID=A0A437ST73_9LACO|nr:MULTISPECIES: Sir2 family NAD-dependent protein deacetylase [Lactobacillus]RVU70146.1 Sir2 family NAD-dependent protein deacetylase [Lactobacillus xujianguonis]RVU73364.1 Sir2 family NAD-dependent protein deacetylase [Lactobacillus xujianguonis]